MKIRDLRVAKLKAFIDEEGGGAAMERKFDGINKSYLSQLVNGYREFGETAARNMEKKCHLSEGYFDEIDFGIVAESLEEQEILKSIRSVFDGGKNMEDAFKKAQLDYLQQLIYFFTKLSMEHKDSILMTAQAFYTIDNPDDRLSNPFKDGDERE